MATVVSAYFPITSKFPPEKYLFWIKTFFENIPCSLVFFTVQDLIPLFTEWRGKYMDRTIFIAFDFLNEAEAFKKYGKDFWASEHEKDQEYDYFDKTRKIHSPELYAIWYEKKEFVLKAIALNPFKHEKFLWADAGGFRVESWLPRLINFPNPDKIHDSKFFLLNINQFQEENYLTQMKDATIGGGYLAAHKDVWPVFSQKYDAMLEEYKYAGLYVGKDQNIMASMYIKEPDFFDLVSTNLSCEDPWFWPQLYFSEETMPLVSVLIPLYNGIEYLSTSLTSIFEQTFTSWKVIIGINGHPQNSEVFIKTSEIVAAIESKYNIKNKVEVLQLDTKGKPASMNKMCECVKTSHIAILDVDDIWLPTKLEEQVPLLSTFDVVGTQCQYFGEWDGIPNNPMGNINEYNFFQGNPLINSSIVMKTQYMKYDESEITGVEDYELWLRLRYTYTCRFFNISKVLVGHRVHKMSAFNFTNNDDLPTFLEKQKAKYEI